ncbi:uncharacterized protein LOC126906774 [Daktulosphaira vitifoliae]|uniref:uncharacterized protein LOC126906774 n=1 Tax=Daktulosphaira vitifoliae TaxID=58002 RepID=UPI0021AA6E16|nr:uncharacterized protein LOC126906774 [Daktulosphaira vitifoliae]
MHLNNFIVVITVFFLFLPHNFVLSDSSIKVTNLNNIAEQLYVNDFNYIVILKDKIEYYFEDLFHKDLYKKYIVVLRSPIEEIEVNEEEKKEFKTYGKKIVTRYLGLNDYNFLEKREMITSFLKCKYLEQIRLINRLLIFLINEYFNSELNNFGNMIQIRELLKEKNESLLKFISNLIDNYKFLSREFGMVINNFMKLIDNAPTCQKKLQIFKNDAY